MKLLYSLLVILVSVACTLSSGVYRVNVKETNLNIRKEPNTKSDIVGKLKKGQYIYATSVSDGWAEFYKGYCSMDYLVKEDDGTEYTTNGNLNFRTGPSPDYKIITTLKKGTNVTYFGSDPFTNNWAVTSEGYANEEYLNMGGNASSSTGAGVYRVNVKETNLNIRKEPNTKSDIVGKLKKGQYIYATSVSDGWAKFYKGYCSMDYLVKENDGTESVTNGNLNFRMSPSSDSKIITTLEKGTKVTYFDNDPFTINWAVTSEGYANAEYLIIGDNTSSSIGAGVYKVNVKETNLNIRKEPNTKSDIVGKLKKGQYIYATTVSNGWAKFYKGYCSMEYLVKVSNGTECATNGNLNFRTGPSTDYKIITTLEKGTKVTYFDSDPFTTNWAVTSEGYANEEYLNIEDEKQGITNGEQSTNSTLIPEDSKQSTNSTLIPEDSEQFTNSTLIPEDSKQSTNSTLIPEDSKQSTNSTLIPEDSKQSTNSTLIPEDSKQSTNSTLIPEDSKKSTNSTLIPEDSELSDSEQFTNSTLIPEDSELSDSEQTIDSTLIPEDSELSDSEQFTNSTLIPEDSELDSEQTIDSTLIPEDSESDSEQTIDSTLILEDNESDSE